MRFQRRGELTVEQFIACEGFLKVTHNFRGIGCVRQ
jgi:hypothetical protein